MAATARTQKQMIAAFRTTGRRMTPQREAILAYLAARTDHPSVRQIHRELSPRVPSLSLATVYKTLKLLKELDEVLELGFPEGGNRYDGNKAYPHPHVICVKCKKIIDPELSTLEDMAEEIARETGFRILEHRLDFFGLCGDCGDKS